MLKLFLAPPEGVGSECWIKAGTVGCYCSNPKRGPFYVSQVMSTEKQLGKLLWLLGGQIAKFGVPNRGSGRVYAAKRLYDRMQLADTAGTEHVGKGVLTAKAMLRGLTFRFTDDAKGIRKGTKSKELIVGMKYLCNSDVFAQQAVFLAGYWSTM